MRSERGSRAKEKPKVRDIICREKIRDKGMG